MAENPQISVPPDLLEQWRTAPRYTTGFSGRVEMVSMGLQRLQEIADQAAQYGADRRLDACCKWLSFYSAAIDASDLRAAMTPKPPSLAEQARVELDRLIALISSEGALAMAEPIRRALERLQELEGGDG